MSLPKPNNCEYCEYPTPDLEEYGAFQFQKRFPDSPPNSTKWLCRVCSRALGQNAFEPRDADGNRDVLRAICYIGNQIIWEIKAVEERLEQKISNKP
jgi:hypothetical protein